MSREQALPLPEPRAHTKAPVQVVLTYLQKYGEWNLAVFALVVIVLMRFSMEGLASLFDPLWRRMWAGRG